MTSLYQTKDFAEFWNNRAGNDGEPYKRYVLDPIMLKELGPINGKVILELGCGNGYLAKTFLKQEPKKLILADLSKYNLAYAAEKVNDKRVETLRMDATRAWNIPSSSLHSIYSNMMLNEVKNIKTPIQEAYRCLKKKGKFIFSVTHPSWDLFNRAQELAGKPSSKMNGLRGYFERGFASFMMKNEEERNYYVSHFQRPFSDYFQTLKSTGFEIEGIIEPELNQTLLKHHPRFISYKDHPVGLIFCCKRNK
jgi:ubiquinone/menaquinone biosynthesis C-methylase UbiE